MTRSEVREASRWDHWHNLLLVQVVFTGLLMRPQSGRNLEEIMFLFGVLDQSILLICLVAGCEIQDYLPVPRRFRCKAVGAALGALVGNGISDGVAGLSMGLSDALAVTAGCMVVVPALFLAVRRLAATTA
ncbi:MAG: hypothetical protein CL489_03385 [Acidobacteria bacterium]|nr:hypothetical protein [Acidobacteriota bacterium]|tara:strand:- start:246 stop:638 length:393 start_codon:yes stop_codon:yes gene_type:complete